jgi:hypothetical protein
MYQFVSFLGVVNALLGIKIKEKLKSLHKYISTETETGVRDHCQIGD